MRKGYDGRWPAQGWTGKQEWTGFADFDDLPRVLDPGDGFIVTANNAVVPADYPVFLTDDWDAGYRAGADPVAARGGWSPAATSRREDLMAVQRDTRNNLAPALLPALLAPRCRDAAARGSTCCATGTCGRARTRPVRPTSTRSGGTCWR